MVVSRTYLETSAYQVSALLSQCCISCARGSVHHSLTLRPPLDARVTLLAWRCAIGLSIQQTCHSGEHIGRDLKGPLGEVSLGQFTQRSGLADGLLYIMITWRRGVVSSEAPFPTSANPSSP